MFATIARLYRNGQLSDEGLDAAVAKGWITQAQADDLRTEASTG